MRGASLAPAARRRSTGGRALVEEALAWPVASAAASPGDGRLLAEPGNGNGTAA